MNIPKETLDQLFMNLGEYNPVTNDAMERIAIALRLVGIAIVSILFLVELNSYVKKFDSDSGGLTSEVYLHLAIKYLMAYALIMTSNYLVDGIVWFGIKIGQIINSIVEVVGVDDAIPPLKKMKMFERIFAFMFRIFAYLALILSGWIGTILIFLRGLELYIIKAFAPILLAFFVHDDLRSITIGFVKYVMAVVLQGALLVLIIGLIPIITANDFLGMGALDGNLLEKAGTAISNIIEYFTLILKYIVVIVLLIGSQRKAKQFMGAM